MTINSWNDKKVFQPVSMSDVQLNCGLWSLSQDDPRTAEDDDDGITNY